MFIRPRRLRRTQAIRDLVAETDLRARHPVSYTHLDVYKRQVARRSAIM